MTTEPNPAPAPAPGAPSEPTPPNPPATPAGTPDALKDVPPLVADPAQTQKSVFSDNADNDTTSWTDSLPDELKSAPQLKKFKSANDVVKSYLGLCSLAGKKGLMPPPEGAVQNETDAYLAARRAGVDSPDAYSVKFEHVKNFGVSEEAFKAFSKNLFDAGLSDREHAQVVRTFAQWREYERAAFVQENNAACEQALIQAKHSWGMKFDEKLASVRSLMDAFPEAKQALESMGVQNNFAVLDMLAVFADAAREGGSPRASGKSVDSASIDAQIEKLVASEAYADANSPAHAAAMEQFWKLSAMKASGN